MLALLRHLCTYEQECMTLLTGTCTWQGGVAEAVPINGIADGADSIINVDDAGAAQRELRL